MQLQRSLLLALSGAALLSALPAQAPNRFVPEGSTMVLRVASPAKWRTEFGGTRVAELFRANTLAPMMAMAGAQFDQMLDQLRQSGMFSADLVEGLLNEWQGDIVMSVQFDADSLSDAMMFGDQPKLSMVVALSPDGKFDLAAVATEFEKAVEKSMPPGEGLKDLLVGDLTLRRTDNGGDEPDIVMPAMIDGHLVMALGNGLDESAAQLLGDTGRMALGNGDAPFHMQLDLESLIAPMIESMDDGTAPISMKDIMATIGFSALTDVSLTLRPDGDAVAGAMHIGMKEQGRGMFDMMVASSSRPKLLSSVPPNIDTFSVSSFDVMPVYRTAIDVWTMLEGLVPMSADDALQTFAEATKVRLEQDLLAHLGKEMLVVQDYSALEEVDFEADDPNSMFAGQIYGISLSDGKAFGESLETALRSRGLHVGRKTEDYAGVKLNRMKLLGMVDLEYVVDNDVLLIAIGDQDATRATLRRVLDARKNGDGGPSEAVKERIAALPDGWNSVSVTAIGGLLDGMMTGISASLEQMGERSQELEMAKQIVQGLTGDMKRLDIDTMVGASYVDASGLTSRFRW